MPSRVRLWIAIRVRNGQVINGDFFSLDVGSDTVMIEFTKKLDPQQTIKGHEEKEKYGHIVNLMAGTFEDLLDSRFGHGKLEEDSYKSDHDKRSRASQHGQGGIRWGHLQDFEGL